MTSTTGPPGVPLLTTNNGVAIPQIGLGTGQVNGDDVVASIGEATRVGYRLIDTAKAYENEADVGRGIRACGLERDELFVSTKLHRADHGYDATLAAIDGSMERLGLEVIDCFLIHFPLPLKDKYVETWKAFERLQRDGRVRVIGVSNFALVHLRRLIDECAVVPAINQIELHPGFPQAELRAFHREHGILTEAWSPIGHGRGVLSHDVITGVAAAHGRSPAQVVLRWQVQLGNIAIPGSTNPDHIRANLDVFDFELSGEEMDAITGIGCDDRLGPDPEIFNPPDDWRPEGQWALRRT
jgi:2,5-diketo-D-gluconate reductase A